MKNLIFTFLICAFGCFSAIAQISVTGTVTDNNGEAVIGATVLEIGTVNGTVTDIDGNFSIEVSSPNASFTISYIGLQSQTIALNGRKSVNVVLQEDTQMLQDVVAIGYGSQKKKEVTGSVASIKSENFNAGVKNSPIGLLQGKVAGLNISRQGGDPTNTGYKIQIRGFSTLDVGTGSEPLYIVDGIPVNNIDNLAPDDIQAMDVLKDGSAAAIYGTRGTNGVIIITTKRGQGLKSGEKCGTTTVDYSGYASYSVAKRYTGLATPDQYYNLADISGGKVNPNIQFNGKSKTDWMAEMLSKTPIAHNHNLAVSGSGKNYSYRASLNFKDAQGVAKYSHRMELSGKLAADQTALNGWVNLQYDLVYMRYRNDYNCGDFKQAAILNPTYPVYDANNKESGFYIPNGSGQSNPVAAMEQKESFQTGNFFRGSIRATINILPVEGLKVSGFAALEEGDNYNYWYNQLNFDSDKGLAGRKTAPSFNQLYEVTVDYVKSFGKHNLAAVLGASYQKFDENGSEMNNDGFPSDDFKYYVMDGFAESSPHLKISTWWNSPHILISQFGRVNYNYAGKYLVSASLRHEGSSRFGKNRKWGYFPAASLGWMMSNEKFMEKAEWVNQLKLRFGFGITGNALKDGLLSIQLFGKGGTFWYNSQWTDTYKTIQNENPNLKWETKAEYNLGVDFSFLKDRLYGSIDAYVRNTNDLLWLYDVDVKPPYIYSTMMANAGAINSKGLEIVLNGVIVKSKDWEWITTPTIAFNKNIITKLSDPSQGFFASADGMLTGAVGENGIQGVNTQKIVEGQPIGTFFGWKYYGLNDEGEALFETPAGGYTTTPTDADRMVIGHAQPLFTYGWNNTIRWKNLDLSVFFRGVFGNDVLNVKRWAYAPEETASGTNVFMKDVKLLAKGAGLYKQSGFSSYYLEKGSYIKLDNITLGYTLPIKENKVLSKLRIYLTGENLFAITAYSGIDPEVNTIGVRDAGVDGTGFYPSIANVMFGINISFK
ncbi:MAG: SusC/RagA family TonB-linked outer membrane protein [Prevotellaceae bacterium]|jgi:TonB-linked SusC/RagA family outer membrane protein|nr:SusC/RagA family TonB-linked outer membrane protein [Prevotellaceae bacterium]